MNDIDALLRYLETGHTPHWYDDSTRWQAAITALIAERDALRDQRDEARRLYCKQMANLSSQQDVTEKWWAEEMGWDCFTEGGGA